MLHLDMDPYLTAPDVWIGNRESRPDVSFPDICTYLLIPALNMLTRAPKLGSLEVCH